MQTKFQKCGRWSDRVKESCKKYVFMSMRYRLLFVFFGRSIDYVAQAFIWL